MKHTSTDWTVLKMLTWATSYFKTKGVRNPRLSIEWLLAHVLKKKRLDLYLIFDRPLSLYEIDSIKPLIIRRANNEPVQYITEETDFFGCLIKVSPNVLIPRPETEELVDWILNKIPTNVPQNVLDIGTGSGCISIALKKNRPDWIISGFDISAKAIQIARYNSKINNTPIHFTIDDIFSPSDHLHSNTFDVIVSNPPYILKSEENTLDREVREYEPSLALFTSTIGKIYRSIEVFASKSLSEHGLMMLELNERFGQQILQLFSSPTWHAVIKKDSAGKDRFIVVKKLNN